MLQDKNAMNAQQGAEMGQALGIPKRNSLSVFELIRDAEVAR